MITGFGIDCSGFITESAYLAGLRGADFQGYGSGTSGPEATGGLVATSFAKTIATFDSDTTDVGEKFVRPCDFIVTKGHVVYVYGTPEMETDPVLRRKFITEVRTLEANGETENGLRGRTRFYKRLRSFFINNNGVARRWK